MGCRVGSATWALVAKHAGEVKTRYNEGTCAVAGFGLRLCDSPTASTRTTIAGYIGSATCNCLRVSLSRATVPARNVGGIMLADKAFVYMAMHYPHKQARVDGDPFLLLFMLMFFGWVAYLFMVALWCDFPAEKQRDDEDRPD